MVCRLVTMRLRLTDPVIDDEILYNGWKDGWPAIFF